MKRLVICVFCVIFSWGLFAQDKQLFNHLSLGLTAGFEGIGINASMPISPYLGIRAGYSLFPVGSISGVANLGEHEFFQGFTFDLDNIPYRIDVMKGGSGKFMLDVYPGSSSIFRFVGGVYIGNGVLAHLTGDLSSKLSSDQREIAVNGFSVDKEGLTRLDLSINKVMPYLGIGFGRFEDVKYRVCFVFDLGVAFSGGLKLKSYDYSDGGRLVDIESKHTIDNNGTMLDKGIIDKLAGFPILPIMNLGLSVRLF